MSPTEVQPAETLPPVTLTAEQAAAIAAALAAQPDAPYAKYGMGALQKILQVLEPDQQRRSELFLASLSVSAEARDTVTLRRVLERAVVGQRVLVLRYRDGKGQPSRREVEPQLLARSSDRWFLAAWCRERQAPRWFRVDRITKAELTDEESPRRDPGLFGAPSETHPAGRALDRTPPSSEPRRGLRVLPGGRQ